MLQNNFTGMQQDLWIFISCGFIYTLADWHLWAAGRAPGRLGLRIFLGSCWKAVPLPGPITAASITQCARVWHVLACNTHLGNPQPRTCGGISVGVIPQSFQASCKPLTTCHYLATTVAWHITNLEVSVTMLNCTWYDQDRPRLQNLQRFHVFPMICHVLRLG